MLKAIVLFNGFVGILFVYWVKRIYLKYNYFVIFYMSYCYFKSI